MTGARTLSGRVAIVTGGSRGIGAETARRLADAGARVAITYRDSAAESAAVVAQITAAGGEAIALLADIAQPDAGVTTTRLVLEAFGRIDVLVNNAGVFIQRRLEDVDTELFDRLFYTNVRGPLMMIQSVLPHLGEGGRVINVLSTLAVDPAQSNALYGATKAALRALTQGYARDLARRGATINAVAPGVVLTDMMRDAPAAALAQLAKETAAGRLATPDDIAPIIVFLASSDSAWLNGRMLAADGGRTPY